MFLRLIIPLVLLMSFPASVWAGGKVEVVDGRPVINVVVPNLPNAGDNSASSRAQFAVVRQFEEDFPRIFRQKYLQRYQADPQKYGDYDWDKVAVRLVPFSGLKVDGVESDLMSIAGGNPPDVLFVNFRKSDTYIRNGFLYPLDKLEDPYLNTLSEGQKRTRIHPKIWPVIDRKGPNGDKHVWALPTGGFMGRVLAYRKDLFDEAGLAYPTVDWTWDDMLKAAKALTDPAQNRTGLLLRGDPGWNFSTFLWSAGGDVMEYNESTDEWRCVFGSKEAARALDFYTTLTQELWQTKEGQWMRGYAFSDDRLGDYRWQRGEIGMNLVYMDEQFISGLNPDLVGIVPVPKGPTGVRAGELNSRMLGIFSEIKFPAVRDAAWEYIAYQDSDAAAEVRTRILVEGGMGRFVSPRELIRFGYPEVARLAPKGWSDVFRIASETGRPEPYGKNSNLAYRMLGIPVSEASETALRNGLPNAPNERVNYLAQLLQRGEQRANELMIGKVTPEERRTRSLVAAVFLAAVVIAFGFVFYRVFQTFGGTSTGVSANPGFRRRLAIGLMLAPALLSILVWRYYPLVGGSIMGFQDYRMLGDSSWVGLKHFGDMLWDGLWWQSLWNSMRFSFISLVFGFLPPIILAILLQEVPHGKVTYRLLFYLPAVLAGLVTLLLWKQFYDPSPRAPLNAIILQLPAFVFVGAGLLVLLFCAMLAHRFWFHVQRIPAVISVVIGLVFLASISSIPWPLLAEHGFWGLFQKLPEPVQWLKDPRYAMLAIVLPGIWAGAGPGCLIYLAALKGIPDDYYEAAEIDGAGFLDKLITIVIPMMRPLIIISFVGAFIGSWLGSADNVLAMTAGQANTEVAPLNIFYKAFVYLEFGPATAMAWMLGFLLIGFTVYQLRILAKVEFRTTGGK